MNYFFSQENLNKMGDPNNPYPPTEKFEINPSILYDDNISHPKWCFSVTPTARLIYSMINDYTWALNSKISKVLNCPVSRVQNAIRELENRNYVFSIIVVTRGFLSQTHRCICKNHIFIENGGDIEKGVYPFIDQERCTIKYLKPKSLNDRMRYFHE